MKPHSVPPPRLKHVFLSPPPPTLSPPPCLEHVFLGPSPPPPTHPCLEHIRLGPTQPQPRDQRHVLVAGRRRRRGARDLQRVKQGGWGQYNGAVQWSASTKEFDMPYRRKEGGVITRQLRLSLKENLPPPSVSPTRLPAPPCPCSKGPPRRTLRPGPRGPGPPAPHLKEGGR